MTRRSLILVTGTPRSGTTPVGDALALAAGTRSLYEPLNAEVGDRRITRYFEIPGTGGFDLATLTSLLDDLAIPRLRLRPGVFADDRGLRRRVKRVTGSRTRCSYRACRLDRRLHTIVWKDPFAAFLVPEAAERGIPVVVTIRPPHAVAASFVRLGWRFDVDDLTVRFSQRRSPGVVPPPRAPDASAPAVNAAVLWQLVYSSLLGPIRAHPLVHAVAADALARDPVPTMERLFQAVGLPWDERTVRAGRRRFRVQAGPAVPSGRRAHGSARDVREIDRYWKDVLDPEDVRRVDELTGELWAELRATVR